MALYYCSELILSQSFQPMAAQLSMKDALPLAKVLRQRHVVVVIQSPDNNIPQTTSHSFSNKFHFESNILKCIPIGLYNKSMKTFVVVTYDNHNMTYLLEAATIRLAYLEQIHFG